MREEVFEKVKCVVFVFEVILHRNVLHGQMRCFSDYLGLGLCRIWISVDFTASTASIFNLLTLSLDRYWSITSPLQYLGKRTRARALVLIGVAWGLSLLWVIPIFGWKHFVKDDKSIMDVSDH